MKAFDEYTLDEMNKFFLDYFNEHLPFKDNYKTFWLTIAYHFNPIRNSTSCTIKISCGNVCVEDWLKEKHLSSRMFHDFHEIDSIKNLLGYWVDDIKRKYDDRLKHKPLELFNQTET